MRSPFLGPGTGRKTCGQFLSFSLVPLPAHFFFTSPDFGWLHVSISVRCSLSESKGKLNILSCKVVIKQNSHACGTESQKSRARRKFIYYISYSSQMRKWQLKTITNATIWALCKVLFYTNPFTLLLATTLRQVFLLLPFSKRETRGFEGLNVLYWACSTSSKYFIMTEKRILAKFCWFLEYYSFNYNDQMWGNLCTYQHVPGAMTMSGVTKGDRT